MAENTDRDDLPQATVIPRKQRRISKKPMPGLMTLTVKAIRDLLFSNGTMTKEGTLNKEMAAKLGWTVRDVESVLQKP